MTIAFDTLKLADRLEAAGMPPAQAKGVAAALAEALTANLVTRDYLDLRPGEIRAEIRAIANRLEAGSASIATRLEATVARLDALTATVATKAELAEAKAEILRWVIGAIGFQTVIILGAVAALIRLLH